MQRVSHNRSPNITDGDWGTVPIKPGVAAASANIWTSDSADYLTIEVHDTPVHDILDDPDALAKARETGIVFKNYDEALQSEYRSAVEHLSGLISDRLAEKKALDTYKELDGEYHYPKWYKTIGSFIDSDDDDDEDDDL